MNKKKSKRDRGYAKKYQARKKISRKLFPYGERVLTWPEIWQLEKDKENEDV